MLVQNIYSFLYLKLDLTATTFTYDCNSEQLNINLLLYHLEVDRLTVFQV